MPESKQPTLFIAAKAFIVHEGRVLVLREAPTKRSGTHIGEYQVPGGRMRPDETFEEALRRETREECGLELSSIVGPLYVTDWWPVVNGQRWHIVGMFMLCESHDARVALSSEHDAFEWIDPKEHDAWDLVENEHPAFEAYLRKLS